MCVCIGVCIHMYLLKVCACMCVCMGVYTRVLRSDMFVYVCASMGLYTCNKVCVCTCIFMGVYICCDTLGFSYLLGLLSVASKLLAHTEIPAQNSEFRY